MRLLLFAFYWFLGFLLAVGACCAIGMAINTLIALFKSAIRARNLWFMLLYLFGGALAATLVWGGLFLAGWIGDRTGHSAQIGLVVGAVFPGIFSLSIIPQFVVVALRQTSGVEDRVST